MQRYHIVLTFHLDVLCSENGILFMVTSYWLVLEETRGSRINRNVFKDKVQFASFICSEIKYNL